VTAIANPAPWATMPDLPRIAWETIEPLPEPEPVAFKMEPESRTHCAQGHPFDGGNTYINPSNGWRLCRACRRENYRRYYHRVYRSVTPRQAPPKDPKPTPTKAKTPKPIPAPSVPTPTPPALPTSGPHPETVPVVDRPPVPVDPVLLRAKARIAERRARMNGEGR